MASMSVQELPLAGGHVALDLINTVEPRFTTADQVEHLVSPADLLAWAHRVGLIDDAETTAVRRAWSGSPAQAAADLDAALELREALYRTLSGDRDDLALLAGRWAAAGSRTTLVAEGGGYRLAVAASIPDRLAVAAVDLLTTADLTRLHACPVADGGCGWLFLDLSRNGSRRWCVMEDCGAKAKARRLTERRRTSRAAARA